ncbi:MAG: GntR family transcriptional regulator [Actinomycetota bacterium]
MPQPAVPKYQHIYGVLRQRILDGVLAPGERLASQQELAESFGVTLMTLRQAMVELQRDGLVWSARGKGTFVADRPVDIALGNLSSFAQQMHATGVTVDTEILDVSVVEADEYPPASVALAAAGSLSVVTRRRSAGREPFSLQRSYLSEDLAVVDVGGYEGDSLYDAIEAKTGWSVSAAKESIAAVALSDDDADILDAPTGHPALRSIRISLNQFDEPFLYDEALLVSGRCAITADRSADRLSIRYDVADGPPPVFE